MSIEKRVKKLEDELIKYKDELQSEKIKNSIYTDIIKNNTNIKLSELEKKISETTIATPATIKPENEVVLNTSKYNFDEIFSKINSSKNIQVKYLKEIKKMRSQLSTEIDIDVYIQVCEDHVKKFTQILTDKNTSDKKIHTNVSKLLTSIDKRLIRYNGYVDEHIDIEELRKFNNALTNQTRRCNTKIFSERNVCQDLHNYGMVLFSVKNNIERVLTNSEPLKIIYVNNATKQSDNPFSFYCLASVDNRIKKWNMDCRLENLTSEIIGSLLPYTLDIFKKIYKDVFGDNEYRKEFIQKCQITEYDCQQLIQNIFILCNHKKLCDILKGIVVKNNTYIKGPNDVFNIVRDDITGTEQNNLKSTSVYTDITKNMFTSIKDEQINEFISLYHN